MIPPDPLSTDFRVLVASPEFLDLAPKTKQNQISYPNKIKYNTICVYIYLLIDLGIGNFLAFVGDFE